LVAVNLWCCCHSLACGFRCCEVWLISNTPEFTVMTTTPQQYAITTLKQITYVRHDKKKNSDTIL